MGSLPAPHRIRRRYAEKNGPTPIHRGEGAAELAPGVCSLAFLPGDVAISNLAIRKPFIF